MATNPTSWSLWHKLRFRFSFVFLGLTSLLCWDLNIFFAAGAFLKVLYDPSNEYKPLTGLFYWLDKYIYHTGYNPKIHDSFPEDNHFGSVFYLFLFSVAIIAAIVWSLLDKKRLNYSRLSHWFNLYMRYVLAITLCGYGLDKLIPVQMPYPNAVSMTAPYGDQSLFRVLWNFMGVSPGYMILVGASEFIAAVLLFFRRTFVFGCLFMIGILVNVVAMNWFYNVPVKMFSAQLLLYALFLVAPYANKLFQFFFNGTATTITPEHYSFKTPWKKYLLIGIMVVIPLSIIIPVIIGDSSRYKQQAAAIRNEKMYDVITFVAKDTLPPLTTDTLRWNRLLFIRDDNAVILNMKNNQDWYECDIDSLKKTYTFHDDPDKKKWHIFNYSIPAKGQLKLTGKWKGQDISVLMKRSPVDSIPLNHEKIKLITD